MVGRASTVERLASDEATSRGAELHPGAWLAWMSGVSAYAFLTSNPLYMALAFIAVLGVYASVADSPRGRAMAPLVLFGVTLAAISIPFNLITGSTGEKVLFELPSIKFPGWFGGVTLGGQITGEAVLASSTRALGIATLVVAAAAFNSTADHFRLLKMAPPALAQVTIVFTIAALVVPQGVERARSVAEGRRLRGRSVRGVKAIAGLVLPVLQSALEGAIQRAESLDARGFGGRNIAPSRWQALLAVCGLGAFAWGAFSYYYNNVPDAFSMSAMAIGALAIIFTLYRGVRRRRSDFGRGSIGHRDWFVLATAGASALLILVLRVTGAGDVTYLPYPDFDSPAFHPAGAAAATMLLAPALLSAFAND